MRTCLTIVWVATMACGEAPMDPPLTGEFNPEGQSYQWRYRSVEVDIDLRLQSGPNPEGQCRSAVRLDVDEAFKGPDRRTLEDIDCSLVELTAGGDVLIRGEASGHNWTRERLEVDTDRRRLQLGPADVVTPAGGELSMRMQLDEHTCPQAAQCKCPRLRRLTPDSSTEVVLQAPCD